MEKMNIKKEDYNLNYCSFCNKKYIKHIDKKQTAVRLICDCDIIITNSLKKNSEE